MAVTRMGGGRSAVQSGIQTVTVAACVDWTPVKETDLRDILFTPVTSYVRPDTSKPCRYCTANLESVMHHSSTECCG